MTTNPSRVRAGIPTGGEFAHQRHDEPTDVALSPQTVDLPDLAAKNPDDLWAELGMPVDDSGRYCPVGVHRRLGAGLSSVQHRGFHARELSITDDGALEWHSPGGCFSARSWTLRGSIDDNGGVTVDTLDIVSPKAGETTRFAGREALTGILGDRVREALAVVGAREIVEGRADTPSGWVRAPHDDYWHNIHGGEVARWSVGPDTVAFSDNDYGVGELMWASEPFGTETDRYTSGPLVKHRPEILDQLVAVGVRRVSKSAS